MIRTAGSIIALTTVAFGGCPADAPIRPPRPQAEPADEVTPPETGPQVMLEPAASSEALRAALAEAGTDATAAQQSPDQGRHYLAATLPHLTPLHRDCVAGSALACWLWDEHYPRVVAIARALGPGSVRCESEASIACAVAAEALDRPSGVGGKPVVAVGGMLEVCQERFIGVCARAAAIRIGSGLTMPGLSEAKAAAIVDEACEQGFADACETAYALLGAAPAEGFETTPQYQALVRVCETGRLRACLALVDRLEPAPFGCDRCMPEGGQLKAGGFDERCNDCSVAACRAEHCCETCEGRHRYACCVEEFASVPQHPAEASLPPGQGQRILEAARAGTERALALWAAGCDRGFGGMCVSEELEERLRALEASVD